MIRRALVLMSFLILASPGVGLAQYPFGKNKVSYNHKDWKVLQTEHVDIYYYPSEENIVSFMAPIVEETFLEFTELFRVEFRSRLPLVFYNSHYDFQQTNIIPSLISEYTGGFTDLIKGRIAIPFTGSMWDLRHVIRHEMVHAFMLEKLAVVMREAGRYNYNHPPLWFVEGMAEYYASHKANTRSNMFVRDALLHGNLPDLANIWRIEGSFMMYKQGESIIRYIATSFGNEAPIELLENWWVADRFTLVLQYTLGINENQLSDKYMMAIKRRFYPSILHGTFAPDAGKQLTPEHSFHSRPSVTVNSDGETLLFANCAHDGAINLCELRKNDQGRLDRNIIVEGGRSSAFESIPAFRSKIDSKGDLLVFVAKRNARDAIYLWDTNKRRKIAHYTFEGLSVISSPTISPKLDRIVFSAIDRSGKMDLYMFDLDSAELTQLTNDPYTEEDPDFHPFEEKVIFSSDKCEFSDRESHGIYVLDLATLQKSALTCGRYSDAHPDWAPDGKSFIFTSDRDGIFNIYRYEMEEAIVVKQTSVLGGVTTPVFMPDGQTFIASGYFKGEFHLFEFPVKDGEQTQAVTVAFVDSTNSSWISRKPKEFTYTKQDYKQKLGLDFAGAGLSLDPNFGSVGNGGALALSDILGNHQYYFVFGNTSQGSDNLLKRLNVGLSYVNLSRRLHYSLGVFHLNSETRAQNLLYQLERRVGASVGVSYPFSKFNRIDGSLVMRWLERESDFDYASLNVQRSFVGSTFLTYVSDNTAWTIGGPLKGYRYYVTAGRTHDFRNRGFESTTLQLDIRKYFRVSRRIVLANRFITRNSWGSENEIFYLGGPWDLRGYGFRDFVGRSTYLFNNELRFPLIDRFNLALPFGAIEFPLMRGSVFFDAGKVDRLPPFETEWLGTIGAGAELNLGFAPVIRVNFTRQTDFDTISSDTDWEFFIGLNY